MTRQRKRARLELEVFFTAWVFFTRLPAPQRFFLSEHQTQESSQQNVPTLSDPAPNTSSQAARYLPLIGLLIGCVAATVFLIASLIWPVPLAVLLSMVSTILLTGALHEDGWADVCDGFGGGWTRDDVLRIMQDSHLGAYGAIGLVLMLLAKFSALVYLASTYLFSTHLLSLGLVFVAGHALSRLASVSLLWRLDYARDASSGKSHALANRLSGSSFAIAAGCGLLPVIALGADSAIMPVVAGVILAMAVCWWMGHYFERRIGGYTGDCLGAVQQATEVVFYFGLLVAW